MKDIQNDLYKGRLQAVANYMFFFMGLLLTLVAVLITVVNIYTLISCFFGECDLLFKLLDFVGYLIIAVAIFDVGRYLLEEEVFRDRELRSPREARQSLTKFMVIIVIAVTLESLLNVLRAGATDIRLLIYPVSLFFVAGFLLIALGVYQRFSVLTEIDVQKTK